VELLTIEPRRRVIAHKWEEMRICYLGDMQYAGKKAHGTALGQLKDKISEEVERGAYFIGMGDYIDFLSPSNRQRLRSAALYDTAEDVIDEKSMELTQELYELALRPTVGRWLGLVEGHHFAQLKSGDTTDMRLCEMLKAPFLGTCGVLRINFSAGTRKMGVTLWVHHGHGNGQTGYYPLARLSQFSASQEGVDAFAIGHTTKLGHLLANRMGYRWNKKSGKAYHRTIHLIGTGGYSRAYVEGAKQGRVPRGGYAEQQMLGPAVIGSPTLIIRPVYDCTKNGENTVYPVLKVEA
jgi:hypothetical protein